MTRNWRSRLRVAHTEARRRREGGDAPSPRDIDAVYVVDRNNARVVRWDRGAREGALVAVTLGLHQLACPGAVAVKLGGLVMVAMQGMEISTLLELHGDALRSGLRVTGEPLPLVIQESLDELERPDVMH